LTGKKFSPPSDEAKKVKNTEGTPERGECRFLRWLSQAAGAQPLLSEAGRRKGTA